MQKFFVSHKSALEFYRNARINLGLDLENSDPTKNTLTLFSCSNQPPVQHFSYSNAALRETLPYCGDNPLHFLTRNKNYNRRKEDIVFHYSSYPYLRNSFLKYTEDIYVSSPALLFCQLANCLNIEQLLQVGLEMCGTYSKSTFAVDGYMYNIPSLTNAYKIKTYVQNLVKRNQRYAGIKNALRASKLLIDNCASPKEANLYIKLSAPRNLGGYEISNLKANYQIPLSPPAQEILKYPTIKPDLCNTKTKVAIEYDSNAFHDNAGQNERDKLRAAAIQYDGWKLFAFVPNQLRDVYSFHNIAIKILKANKQETRIRTKNFDEKRRALWMSLNEIF